MLISTYCLPASNQSHGIAQEAQPVRQSGHPAFPAFHQLRLLLYAGMGWCTLVRPLSASTCPQSGMLSFAESWTLPSAADDRWIYIYIYIYV